jgi:hypothetical protein
MMHDFTYLHAIDTIPSGCVGLFVATTCLSLKRNLLGAYVLEHIYVYAKLVVDVEFFKRFCNRCWVSCQLTLCDMCSYHLRPSIWPPF